MKNCRKCGSYVINTRWDSQYDNLNHRCSNCGYTSVSLPLDRLKDIDENRSRMSELLEEAKRQQ